MRAPAAAAAARSWPPARLPGCALGPLPAGAARAGAEGVRRLAERCDHARSAARGARRLPVDRARQALHHDRDGDRPGQDLEPERARDRGRTALDVPIPQVGLTTFRMPYTPVTFGSFAGISRGDLFDPVRTTPTHEWAAARGAVFENVGLWKRARYFPRGGEDMHAAVARECRAVRSACGIFDASTLGKIEVVGADAAEFMNRLYVNSWSGLGVGRSRYGILLPRGRLHLRRRRGGAARARDRFHVTTTTGGAPRVLAHDGGLPPDRMAGSEGLAHLHHRAMGGDRGAGTERARACSSRWSKASTWARRRCRT